MDIPKGWKKGQRIEISRDGDWILIEPDIKFGDTVDPDIVMMTFHKSDYGKFRDWLKGWLDV